MKNLSMVLFFSLLSSLLTSAAPAKTTADDSLWLRLELIRGQVIDWQVGEHMTQRFTSTAINYTARSEVMGEEGESIWVKTVEDYGSGVTRLIEALIQRADGKTIKLLIDGKEIPLAEPIEWVLVESGERNVDVPAGNFAAKYVKYKARDQEIFYEGWFSATVSLHGYVKTVYTTPEDTQATVLTDFGK